MVRKLRESLKSSTRNERIFLSTRALALNACTILVSLMSPFRLIYHSDYAAMVFISDNRLNTDKKVCLPKSAEAHG